VGGISIFSCNTSATPLPGWKNCHGTVDVTVNVPSDIKSGYISVYFNFPDDGSFYHGQIAIGSSPATYTVSMTNDYVPGCLSTSISTSVDVYDGSASASNAPRVGGRFATLGNTCPT
jgi:hypothetical protein